MLKSISDALERLIRTMQVVAGILVVGTVMITAADVASRKLFSWTRGQIDFTFSGGIELVTLGMMYALLFCMPYAVDRGQIIMDLLIGARTPRLTRVLDTVYMTAFASGSGFLAWAMYNAGLDGLRSHERTADLHVPMSVLDFSASALFLLLAIRTALVAVDVAQGRRSVGPTDAVAHGE